MSIWDDGNDKLYVFCGYAGLPQQYIDRLYQEFKAYGLTSYKIGAFVIAETIDMVVVSEIMKRIVPTAVISNPNFKAILGTAEELKIVEEAYRGQEDAIKSGRQSHTDEYGSRVRSEEGQQRILRQSE